MNVTGTAVHAVSRSARSALAALGFSSVPKGTFVCVFPDAIHSKVNRSVDLYSVADAEYGEFCFIVDRIRTDLDPSGTFLMEILDLDTLH